MDSRNRIEELDSAEVAYGTLTATSHHPTRLSLAYGRTAGNWNVVDRRRRKRLSGEVLRVVQLVPDPEAGMETQTQMWETLASSNSAPAHDGSQEASPMGLGPEPVPVPEWTTVPWHAGSLHFPHQTTGPRPHVVDTGAQVCLHPVPENPSPRPKKPRKRYVSLASRAADRVNHNRHDSPERQARRRANKLILTGQDPQALEDNGP